MISQEAKAIIKANGVETQKYQAWAISDFGKKTYLFGLCISTILFLFIIWVGIDLSFHPFNCGTFLYFVGLAVFFFVMFATCSVAAKNRCYYDDGSGDVTVTGFVLIGMYRKTDVSYLQKISAAKWNKIRNFDLEKFQRKQQALKNRKKPFVKKEVILKLEGWQKIFKKVCLYSGILAGVLVAGFFFEINIMLFFSYSFVMQVLTLSLVLFSYSGMIWYLIFALIGLLKKEVVVSGEYEESTVTGTGAVIWGVVNLVGGVLVFLFLNFAIIYLLIYRFPHQ